MPRSTWSVVADALVTVVMLIGPALLASRVGWPLAEGNDWTWLWQYLRGGRIPDEAVLAALVVVLWAVWAVHLVVVILDIIALLRGLVPRVGLVRLVWVLVAGGATATSTHTTTAVAAQNDTVAESYPQPSSEVQAFDVCEEETSGQANGVVDRIRSLSYFGFDSAALTPAMMQSLQPTVELISDFGLPEGPVVVTGHTDPVGEASYNEDLSQRRAQEVADYLAQHLDEDVELQVSGSGSTQPPHNPQAPYGEHRRVEIAYTLQPPTATSEPVPPVEDGGDETSTDAPEPEQVQLDVTTASEQNTGPDPILVGAVTGAVGLGVGYAAGRRRAPRPRARANTQTAEQAADDGLALDLAECTAAAGGDLLREDSEGSARGTVDEDGYVLVTDTVRVNGQNGLAFEGAHAAQALAAVVTGHTGGPLVVTSNAVRALGMAEALSSHTRVVPDLPAARIAVETELLAAARRTDETENAEEAKQETATSARTLMVCEPGDLGADRSPLTELAQTPGVVCVLGHVGGAGTTLDCEDSERVRVVCPDAEALLAGRLRLWSPPQEQEEAREPDVDEEPTAKEPEEGPEEAGKDEHAHPSPSRPPEAAPHSRVGVRLFAPRVVCEVDGRDVLQGARASAATLLAVLALGSGRGVSHEEVTRILTPRMEGERARRYYSCTSGLP